MQVETTRIAQPIRKPQFSLRAIFGATTWIASIVGLAVNQPAGWTMFAIGFSLASFNCAGWLAPCQTRTVQTRMFRAAWLLVVVSLVLPAVKGCGNSSCIGWKAAITCGELTAYPPWGEERSHWCGYALFCLLSLANLLLALSPLFLWRLRRGKGEWYGAIFVVAAPAMWCCSIHDTDKLLVGYYVWCSAGMLILCAFRMRWAMLPLTAAALCLAW